LQRYSKNAHGLLEPAGVHGDGDESNGLARPVNMPLKTILVLVVAIATFNLGRYSVEFSAVVRPPAQQSSVAL
jgi:hypothetical protein